MPPQRPGTKTPGLPPPAPPPPWSAGLEPLDASPVAAAEGSLRLREAPPPRRAASPCGRALVHAAAREDYVGSALVTHPPLGLGRVGEAGLGTPSPTLEPGSCGSGALAAASILSSLSNPPQTKSARRASGDPKEGHKKTPKRARLSLPWPWLE